jgi:hypothetical protein
MDVALRFELALFLAGGGGGDFRLGARCMLAGELSSLSAGVEECPRLRRVGGGGGGAAREEVVLSAMDSLSSMRECRIEPALLRVRSSEGIGARWEERRASGGGGGFLGCVRVAWSVVVMSGLGVGSRRCSPDVAAPAKASLIAVPLAAGGNGGSGFFVSDVVRDFDLSSEVGLVISASCWPIFEKSSNPTICGPVLVTDLPCLCRGRGGFTRLLRVLCSNTSSSPSLSDSDRS